jgi:hypothetical protein
MRLDASRSPDGVILRTTCAECGKYLYPTRHEAKRGAQLSRDKKLRPYQAHGGWHLTSIRSVRIAKIREMEAVSDGRV